MRFGFKGFDFSVVGIGLLPFTAMSAFLLWKFPRFKGLWVMTALFLLINIAFFIRWTKASFWTRLGRSNRLLPRKLKLSNEGRFLLLLTFGVGFAAVNTGNNLFYLVMGLLLSLIVLSGILSELVLRKLAYRKQYPARCQAGEPCTAAVVVENQGRRWNSFSVVAEEVFDDLDLVQIPGRLACVSPESEATAFVKLTFAARGLAKSAGFLLSTTYPFSFFLKSRFFPERSEFIVHPRTDRKLPQVLEALRGWGEEAQSKDRGRGGDFHSARPGLPADDPRDMHWKRSAALGHPVVKEYERNSSRSLVIMLPCQTKEGRAVELELSIEVAASLARELVMAGWRVGLAAPGLLLLPSAGEAQLQLMLDGLALVRADNGDLPETGVIDGGRALRVLVLQSWQRASAEADLVVSVDGEGSPAISGGGAYVKS